MQRARMRSEAGGVGGVPPTPCAAAVTSRQICSLRCSRPRLRGGGKRGWTGGCRWGRFVIVAREEVGSTALCREGQSDFDCNVDF
jgi:hypothetical protein